MVKGTEEIARGEDLTPSEREIIILAAWFHDTGYVKTYIGHEEESAEIAAEFLSGLQYPAEKIEMICDCIMATKFRHDPNSLPEAVLIDADRLAMGKPDFPAKGEQLRKEWAIYLEKEYTDKEWADVQLQYLNETHFHTSYARSVYGEQRENNIRFFREESVWLALQENPISKQSRLYIALVKKWISTTLLSLILGLIISLSLSLTVWGSYDYSIGIAAISGLFIGLMLRLGDAQYEKYIMRRFSFPASLLLGSVLLVALFKVSQFVSVFIYEFFFMNATLEEASDTDIFRNFLDSRNFTLQLWLAFLVSIILNFIKLTSRIIGPRVLLNYLQGKYHRPVEEERIFMFLDLNSSTRMAEQMDIMQYHRLLNKFFNDLAGPVSRYKGEIYQYVGDEVVVTWKMEDGIKNSNCVRCFFRIQKIMNRQKDSYIKEFGFMPDFKAGLHGGNVVTGQVGKSMIDIVFHGDVINTTEHIMAQCKPLDKKVLISENLVRRIDLMPNLHTEYVTTVLLKGKENEVSLYTLRKD